MKIKIIFLSLIMFSCASKENRIQEIENDKIDLKIENIKSKYSYDIFDDMHFSFKNISYFNCNMDINKLKKFKAEHFDYFKLDENLYDSGCYLVSRLDSFGNIIPIIIYLCPNFDNVGYLYTIDSNYNKIDSIDIFSCYWSSGGDGPYETNGETESFFIGNTIKTKTINYFWIRETDETLIADSVVEFYHIEKDGKIIKDLEKQHVINNMP